MSKYKVEPWPPQPKGGMQTGKIPAGVKVTDTETGYWHYCNIYRSQHQNKDSAIRALQAYRRSTMTTNNPAEQQPMRAADRQENISGGWRSRFLRLMGEMQSELDDSNEDPIPAELWSLWRELLDAAPQPTEQKTAPGVTQLVEALELFVSNPTPTSEDFDMAHTALAAYRKGGES